MGGGYHVLYPLIDGLSSNLSPSRLASPFHPGAWTCRKAPVRTRVVLDHVSFYSRHMAEKLILTVTPNGPLKVENAERIRFCGEELERRGTAFLCRCGESKNAPFCDGSHKTNGFSGENQSPGVPTLKIWEGKTLRTTFNEKTCMHVFHCKPLAELRKREEEGESGAAQEIMRVVAACPSGALSYETKEKIEEPMDAPFEADIDIVEGGEIRVQVDFTINEALHEAQRAARATLCRCGKSKNKPWCDGKHRGRRDFR